METVKSLSNSSKEQSQHQTSSPYQAIKPPESARFYDPSTKSPVFEIVGSTTGKPRNPTIRDARKHGWYPSVTSIIRVVSSSSLEAWKLNNLLSVAINTPRNEEETDEDYMDRISCDADLIADMAADRGKEIHAELSKAIKAGRYDGDDECVKTSYANTCEYIKALEVVNGPLISKQVDDVFVCEDHMFAGSCDLWLLFHNGKRVIIDFKTKDLKDDFKPYFSYKLQLGGYDLGLFGCQYDTELAIIPIDRKTGKSMYCKIEERNCADLFLCANALWRASNKF